MERRDGPSWLRDDDDDNKHKSQHSHCNFVCKLLVVQESQADVAQEADPLCPSHDSTALLQVHVGDNNTLVSDVPQSVLNITGLDQVMLLSETLCSYGVNVDAVGLLPVPNLVCVDDETVPGSASRDVVGSEVNVSHSCTTSAILDKLFFPDEGTSASNNSHTVRNDPGVAEASTLVGSRTIAKRSTADPSNGNGMLKPLMECTVMEGVYSRLAVNAVKTSRMKGVEKNYLRIFGP